MEVNDCMRMNPVVKVIRLFWLSKIEEIQWKPVVFNTFRCKEAMCFWMKTENLIKVLLRSRNIVQYVWCTTLFHQEYSLELSKLSWIVDLFKIMKIRFFWHYSGKWVFLIKKYQIGELFALKFWHRIQLLLLILMWWTFIEISSIFIIK